MGLPPGASFDPRTARLSWEAPETFVPPGQYAASVPITLTASDGFGSGALALTLRVLPNPTDPVKIMATRYEFITRGISQDLVRMDSLEGTYRAEAERRTRRKDVVHYVVIGVSTLAGGFQLARSSATRSFAAGLGALLISSLELLARSLPTPDEPLKRSAEVAPIRAKLEQAYASFKGLYPARPPDAELLNDSFRTAVDGVLSTRQAALQDLLGLNLHLSP